MPRAQETASRTLATLWEPMFHSQHLTTIPPVLSILTSTTLEINVVHMCVFRKYTYAHKKEIKKFELIREVPFYNPKSHFKVGDNHEYLFLISDCSEVMSIWPVENIFEEKISNEIDQRIKTAILRIFNKRINNIPQSTK